MFGRQLSAAVRHPFRDLVKPGVRVVQTEVRAIDPEAKKVSVTPG
jgi:sulfide:quinone oxidoreductase